MESLKPTYPILSSCSTNASTAPSTMHGDVCVVYTTSPSTPPPRLHHLPVYTTSRFSFIRQGVELHTRIHRLLLGHHRNSLLATATRPRKRSWPCRPNPAAYSVPPRQLRRCRRRRLAAARWQYSSDILAAAQGLSACTRGAARASRAAPSGPVTRSRPGSAWPPPWPAPVDRPARQMAVHSVHSGASISVALSAGGEGLASGAGRRDRERELPWLRYRSITSCGQRR